MNKSPLLRIADAPRINETLGITEPADRLWFVKNGLFEEARQHAIRGTGRAGDSFRAGDTGHALFVFERPIPHRVHGPTNLIVTRDGAVVAGLVTTRRTWLDTFQLNEPDAWDFLAAAAMVQRFALLPYAKRPGTDIDAAVSTNPVEPADKKTIPTVLVIRWRRPLHVTGAAADHYAAHDVPWSHRWLVRSHLRRLADGRFTVVREHVKGPEDKPLILKDRINALVR